MISTEQSDTHFCFPYGKKNAFLRTMTLLLSPRKVFQIRKQGFATCSFCQDSIAPSYILYSPIVKAVYVLFGAIVASFAVSFAYKSILLFLGSLLLYALLAIIFQHIISSVVLSVFSWEHINLKKTPVKYLIGKAKGEIPKNFACLLNSYILTLGVISYIKRHLM